LLASIKRRKKVLEKILIQGKVETNLSLFKKAIVKHFKGLYTRRAPASFSITNLGLPRLKEVRSQELIKEVTMEEIKEAVLSCNPTKAPGLDGFNLKCLKHVWSVVGEEFSKCILEFFETGKLPAAINTT